MPISLNTQLNLGLLDDFEKTFLQTLGTKQWNCKRVKVSMGLRIMLLENLIIEMKGARWRPREPLGVRNARKENSAGTLWERVPAWVAQVNPTVLPCSTLRLSFGNPRVAANFCLITPRDSQSKIWHRGSRYQDSASISFSIQNFPRFSDLFLGGFGTGEVAVIEVAQTAAIVSVFLQFWV